MSGCSTVQGFTVFILGVVVGVATVTVGSLPFGITPKIFLVIIVVAWVLSLISLAIMERVERQDSERKREELYEELRKGRESGEVDITAWRSELSEAK